MGDVSAVKFVARGLEEDGPSISALDEAEAGLTDGWSVAAGAEVLVSESFGSASGSTAELVEPCIKSNTPMNNNKK